MKNNLSRRDALRAIGGLPILLATGAAAGNKDDFTGALTQEPRLLGFATARAEQLTAPLTTLGGRLPPELLGVLWRNGPAEHERFGHRYGHWFDGDGMVQAFAFNGTAVTHRGRILDTPKRRRETQAGRRIMPAFATLPPHPEPVLAPQRHERRQHRHARPRRASHGVVGGRLGAGGRSPNARRRPVRRLASGSRRGAVLGPSEGRTRRHAVEHRLRTGAAADAAVLSHPPNRAARQGQYHCPLRHWAWCTISS